MGMKIVKGAEPSMVTWTVKKLVKNMDDGLVDFDIDIQRGYVWKDDEQRSLLIQSAILNDFIPPFYFNKIEGKYDGIDAKQRATTFYKFLHDEFALIGLKEISVTNEAGEEEEIDINGLRFSELEEEIKTAVEDAALSIISKDEMDQEEESRNFYNLNNGTGLNPATKNRVKAKSLDSIIRLGNHKMMLQAVSEVSLNNHGNEDLAVKAHAVLNDENICISAAWIRKYMRETEITKEDEELLRRVFDRIYNIHEIIEDSFLAKRIYTKTHMISVVPIIAESLKDGISDKQMTEWFVGFFRPKGAATVSAIYNQAAGGSGTGKNGAVRARLEEIKKSYDEFFRNIKTLEAAG